MKTIRILIADDHLIVAESLSILIDMMPDFEVVGTVKNGQEVLSFLDKHEVDIVLSDLHMPQMNGIETTIHVRRDFPDIKIILLTMAEDAAIIKEAIAAGIDGYVMKNIEKKELESAIRQVISGQKYFSTAVVLKLAQLPNEVSVGNTSMREQTSLTPRETEIMHLIIQDLSNAEIASKTFISTTTVEKHRRNLMKKLGVNSALGLMRYALKHGLTK